jgi:transcriptional regulator with XRE-family HTH domain
MPAHTPSPGSEERAALFSSKVRQRRHELKLTERDLIERTGLSRGYIQLLLNTRGSHKDPVTGTHKLPNPTLDVIWLLAQALEVNISYLVDPSRPVEPREE